MTARNDFSKLVKSGWEIQLMGMEQKRRNNGKVKYD